MAIEEPKFELVSKNDYYEIRLYGPVLVAETFVQDDFDNAGNKAFRILADYIFGKNKSNTKIAMAAPVAQESKSEKIAMTAPVTQTNSQTGFLVQFTMPAKYNMDNIPKPIDERVVLREIEPKKVAVYTYSGSWSKERYEKKLSEFKAYLEKDGVSTVGEPTFARFNSPFQLWFLRRNEIWLEIAN